MAAYILFDSLLNSLLSNIYSFIKGVYQFVLLQRDIFSWCPFIWGSIFKAANIFWNILGSTYWIQSIQQNWESLFICLFAKLQHQK